MPKYKADILIRMDMETIEALDKVAAYERCSRSALIRRYLAEGLDKSLPDWRKP